MRNLSEIQQIIEKLARPINPPAETMPTYDNFIYDGTPNIEVSTSAYYYREADERGTFSTKKQTDNLAELLYCVFRDITDRMAYEFAKQNQNPSEDFRKAWFEHQLELLEKVKPEWKLRREKEIAEILVNAPYNNTK